MSTMTSSSHLGNAVSPATTAKDAGSQRSVEADPGPWLAITGPLLIALTVVAVVWLSRISF